MKKVSIIVPCFNAACYLDKCMKHLLNQTIGLENIEILLIDDASTDDGETWKTIMKYEKQFPDNIIAIQLKQNMRQGGARNAALPYASGEYLMFCDADDWLALEAMDHLYRQAKQYDLDVVQFQIKAVDDRIAHSSMNIKKKHEGQLLELNTEEDRKYFLLDRNRAFIGNCTRKFYRMHLIHEHQFRFAEQLIFEEPVFTVPVILYEKRHFFLDEELYYYYKSPNSTMRSDWSGRKMDFFKVWMILVNDLEARNLMQKYYAEISYLFFHEGYVGTIHMLASKSYSLTIEELKIMKSILLKLFPDILENSYLKKENDPLRAFFRDILPVKITKEKVMAINEILTDYTNRTHR